MLRKHTMQQQLLVTLRRCMPGCAADSYSKFLLCLFVQYSLWIFNYHRLYYSHEKSCGKRQNKIANSQQLSALRNSLVSKA